MSLFPKKYYLGDDFFDNFFEPTVTNQMKCDVYEKDGNYNIEIDIPGFDKKDIRVECENGYLTISAEKNEEENDEGKNYIRRERRSGSFSRSFYVGDIDSYKIDAEFKKGTLKVIVPKETEETSKKQIEVK